MLFGKASGLKQVHPRLGAAQILVREEFLEQGSERLRQVRQFGRPPSLGHVKEYGASRFDVTQITQDILWHQHLDAAAIDGQGHIGGVIVGDGPDHQFRRLAADDRIDRHGAARGQLRHTAKLDLIEPGNVQAGDGFQGVAVQLK